jgi:hypothetical protein
VALTDKLKAPPAPVGIDKIFEALPAGEADALRAALLDPRFTHKLIADALTDEGYPISPTSVSRWRETHGVTR